MINVGLIGFGLSGRYLQAPFLQAHPAFTLKSVVTSRSDELASSFSGVGRLADVESLLADPALDLISVCSPNVTHYEYAKAALEAGKHVLVEKPACATAGQLRELRELAQRQQRHLFVYQNRRWDSDFLTVRSLLRSDLLGPLHNYEARYDRWKPAPNAKAWKETPGPAAGMIYDLGAHLIDQAVALFGRPDRVTGKSWTQRPFSTIEDAFDLQLTYNDGPHVSLSSSLMVREPTPRYVLHGARGSFVKYGIDQQEDQLKAGLTPNDPGFGAEPAAQDGTLNSEYRDIDFRGSVRTQAGRWLGLYDNIHQCIREGAEPAVGLEEVITQLEIIEAVRGE